MMSYQVVPDKINKNIAWAIIAFHMAVLFALPLLLLPLSPTWALLLVPFIWVHIPHWGLIHEGIHKQLRADGELNENYGRTLSILLGASFHVLKFGHLMHHKMNREWQTEIVETKSLKTTVDYYFTLLGGLYVTEVLSSFVMAALPKKLFLKIASKTALAGHPDVYLAGERFFYERKNIKHIRQDMLLTGLLYVAAFMAYGAYYPILIAYIISRATIISFMDNIYHYETPADNTEAGKDLSLPNLVSKIWLNSNFHETHHLNSNVPWIHLPKLQKEQGRDFDGKLLRDGFKQLRGPIVTN